MNSKTVYMLDKNFDEKKGYILLPKEIECNTTYPVLYLIHGAGEIGCEEWTDTGHGNIENNMNKWSEKYGFLPMVVVIPRIGERFKKPSKSDFRKFGAEIDKFIQEVNSAYYGIISEETSKTAIAGFSMGGAGALYYSHLYQERFIHTGAFSPSCFVHYKNDKGSWIPPSEDMTLNNDTRSIHYIAYGSSEEEFASYSERFIDELNSLGLNVNTYKIEGGWHNFNTFNPALERFVSLDIFNYKK